MHTKSTKSKQPHINVYTGLLRSLLLEKDAKDNAQDDTQGNETHDCPEDDEILSKAAVGRGWLNGRYSSEVSWFVKGTIHDQSSHILCSRSSVSYVMPFDLSMKPVIFHYNSHMPSHISKHNIFITSMSTNLNFFCFHSLGCICYWNIGAAGAP